jgi:hypothetical protein
MRLKRLLLLVLIPLSEIKAIFYTSNIKVTAYLFSKDKIYLCNIVENYSNILIFGIIFYFIAFLKMDFITRKIGLFLFIINFLDLVFIGLMGNEFYLLKIPISVIIYNVLCKKFNGFLIR